MSESVITAECRECRCHNYFDESEWDHEEPMHMMPCDKCKTYTSHCEVDVGSFDDTDPGFDGVLGEG